MTEAKIISLTVNGRPVEAHVDPEMSLLAFLREELRLTGTKNGCSEGACGACTVIVDGQARRSCVTRMKDMAGRAVKTIEAVAPSAEEPAFLHPLQYAMVHNHAIQCGYCTPGMVMAGIALLERNPDPTPEDIRKALRPNLCRCTGFRPIIDAIQEAGRLLRSGVRRMPTTDLWPTGDQVVGESVTRLGSVEKVTGRLQYVGDVVMEGMLYTQVLWAAQPHARVLRVDASAARRAPGVVAVLTAGDVPGLNRYGLSRKDQPVFVEDRVRFLGDVIAAVYAESQAQAAAAVALIEVEYEPLPAVETPQQALAEGAPVLHEGGNVIRHVRLRKGDIAEGFAQADVVVEGEYHTPFIEQAYLEPEAALAVAQDGGVTVYVGSQGPSRDQVSVSDVLGLPLDKVRIVRMPMGGGFGGKEDITVQAIAALGAFHTGRPTRYVWSRRDSILASTKRHAEWLHYRTGATREGKLVAAEVEIIGDGGAYTSVSDRVIFRSAIFGCGPYVIPHVKLDAIVAFTNNPPCGAMRGFGTPQVAFAAEVQMDRLAEALGMDPVDLRLKNILEPGQATITGEVLQHSIGARATLEAVRDTVASSELPAPGPGRRIGVGFAAGYKNVGVGGGGHDRAGARLSLLPDGTVLLRHGAVDMGQGCDTALAQIAAQASGVPFRRIAIHAGDTALDPDAGATTASRQTFLSGNAVRGAAVVLRSEFCAAVAQRLGIPEQAVTLIDGKFFLADGQEFLMTLDELAQWAAGEGKSLAAERTYDAPPTFPLPERVDAWPEASPQVRMQYAYCFGAQAAVVAVDEESNEVEVLKLIAAQDVGEPVNPVSIRGQIEGALVMGLGYATSEEFRMEGGLPVTDRLGKLGLPRVDRLPEIQTIIVHDPHPDGPFGAKGMSELPLSPTAPAIANAIARAVGARVHTLPITAEKIAAARGK